MKLIHLKRIKTQLIFQIWCGNVSLARLTALSNENDLTYLIWLTNFDETEREVTALRISSGDWEFPVAVFRKIPRGVTVLYIFLRISFNFSENIFICKTIRWVLIRYNKQGSKEGLL